MKGYTVELDCHHCGNPLAHLADGRPVAGTEVSAVAHCTLCGRVWQLIVHLRPVARTSEKEVARRLEYRRRVAS